jgi:hypothetical protein
MESSVLSFLKAEWMVSDQSKNMNNSKHYKLPVKIKTGSDKSSHDL